MKMEQIECSETSAYKIQTPGESPRRKHTTYRTRRKFEIKNTVFVHLAGRHQPSFEVGVARRSQTAACSITMTQVAYGTSQYYGSQLTMAVQLC
jgi:hypothetical protein